MRSKRCLEMHILKIWSDSCRTQVICTMLKVFVYLSHKKYSNTSNKKIIKKGEKIKQGRESLPMSKIPELLSWRNAQIQRRVTSSCWVHTRKQETQVSMFSVRK